MPPNTWLKVQVAHTPAWPFLTDLAFSARMLEVRCQALRTAALPDQVDDHVCCAYLYGCSKKVAGRLFNQGAWDASKDR